VNLWAWTAATQRFRDDRYAMQLLDERDLQFATFGEYAQRRGRVFVVLGGVT
jgi:hypothetical protein